MDPDYYKRKYGCSNKHPGRCTKTLQKVFQALFPFVAACFISVTYSGLFDGGCLCKRAFCGSDISFPFPSNASFEIRGSFDTEPRFWSLAGIKRTTKATMDDRYFFLCFRVNDKQNVFGVVAWSSENNTIRYVSFDPEEVEEKLREMQEDKKQAQDRQIERLSRKRPSPGLVDKPCKKRTKAAVPFALTWEYLYVKRGDNFYICGQLFSNGTTIIFDNPPGSPPNESASTPSISTPQVSSTAQGPSTQAQANGTSGLYSDLLLSPPSPRPSSDEWPYQSEFQQ